jgi:hypothetical protein
MTPVTKASDFRELVKLMKPQLMNEKVIDVESLRNGLILRFENYRFVLQADSEGLHISLNSKDEP